MLMQNKFPLTMGSKYHGFPDIKVNGANTGPTWVLSAPDGPHVGPMNLAIMAYGAAVKQNEMLWYRFSAILASAPGGSTFHFTTHRSIALWFNSMAPEGFVYSLNLENFKLISTINISSIFCEIAIRWMSQHLTDH